MLRRFLFAVLTLGCLAGAAAVSAAVTPAMANGNLGASS
jgi:hypothetical protein